MLTYLLAATGDAPAKTAAAGLPNIFTVFANLCATAVEWVLGWCADLIENGPEPDLLSNAFRGQYHAMLQMSGYIVVVIALCGAISGVLRGGLKDVLRTFLIGIPVSVFGGVAAIAVVTLLQKIDNGMTHSVMNHSQVYITSYLKLFNQDNANPLSALMAVGEANIFLMTLICCVFLWLELVFRQLMIYMAVLFIPMALAAYVWPPLRSWFTALAEITATMIFSKFIIATIMSFGFLAVNQGIHTLTDDFWAAYLQYLGGLAVLFVSALAAPTLLLFVMSPSHHIVTQKEVRGRTALGGDQQYAAGIIKTSAGKFINKVRPSKGPSVPSGKIG